MVTRVSLPVTCHVRARPHFGMKTCRFKFEKTISKSGERWREERLYLGVEQSLQKHSRLVSVVSEHYDTNYSSPKSGFKFHARRVFVLRVFDCNGEC